MLNLVLVVGVFSLLPIHVPFSCPILDDRCSTRRLLRSFGAPPTQLVPCEPCLCSFFAKSLTVSFMFAEVPAMVHRANNARLKMLGSRDRFAGS